MEGAEAAKLQRTSISAKPDVEMGALSQPLVASAGVAAPPEGSRKSLDAGPPEEPKKPPSFKLGSRKSLDAGPPVDS